MHHIDQRLPGLFAREYEARVVGRVLGRQQAAGSRVHRQHGAAHINHHHALCQPFDHQLVDQALHACCRVAGLRALFFAGQTRCQLIGQQCHQKKPGPVQGRLKKSGIEVTQRLQRSPPRICHQKQRHRGGRAKSQQDRPEYRRQQDRQRKQWRVIHHARLQEIKCRKSQHVNADSQQPLQVKGTARWPGSGPDANRQRGKQIADAHRNSSPVGVVAQGINKGLQQHQHRSNSHARRHENPPQPIE